MRMCAYVYEYAGICMPSYANIRMYSTFDVYVTSYVVDGFVLVHDSARKSALFIFPHSLLRKSFENKLAPDSTQAIGQSACRCVCVLTNCQ